MTLYTDACILTMEDSTRQPEALLEDGGVIAAVGDRAALLAMAPDAKVVSLDGHTLMPAFVDAHSHFSSYAASLLQESLAGCASLSELQSAIAAFLKKNAVSPGKWIVAKDYDPTTLAQGQYPNADFLDRTAPLHPLILQNRNGHAGVCNHAALLRLGLSDATPDPDGGKYGRNADGTLNGYLEESAFLANIRKIPPADGPTLLDAYRRAQKSYAAHGITTVQEGMMVAQMEPLYRALLSADLLRLDLVGYAEAASAEALFSAFSRSDRRYNRHFKLGGIKLFLDGSPQARTAWMRPQSAYLPTDDSPGQTGYAAMKSEEVLAALHTAAKRGWQVLAHCNGDAAAAQYLAAVAETERQFPAFSRLRPVMIHAQFLAPDQLSLAQRTGVIPSFFAAHVWHWGDVHIRNFGYSRASLLSPAADALRQGILFTFHQDAPVIEPDMLETVWCAVNRQTKSGAALGPGEAISVKEALKAVTINAAYQYFEEREKGTLTPGKRADLIVLDRNPLRVPPETLRDIQILQTIKDGNLLFSA